MLTSNCLYDQYLGHYGLVQPLIHGTSHPFFVKRMIVGEVDGKLNVKETKRGTALPNDLLK
jgi:hypothetical protein